VGVCFQFVFRPLPPRVGLSAIVPPRLRSASALRALPPPSLTHWKQFRFLFPFLHLLLTMCRSYGAFGLCINDVLLTMCRSYGAFGLCINDVLLTMELCWLLSSVSILEEIFAGNISKNIVINRIKKGLRKMALRKWRFLATEIKSLFHPIRNVYPLNLSNDDEHAMMAHSFFYFR
jgi:hypothetical protein